MLLWCPKCNAQHIDEPSEGWDNPPHRSHLCHDCGCIWRPADVPTNGVKDIKTAGDADTWGWTGGDSLLPSLGKRLAAAPATTPTTDSLTADAALIDQAREIAARYFENDPLDKARKAVAADIRKGGNMDYQDATQIALYALCHAIRALPLPAQTVPADVAALVVAAREACAYGLSSDVDESRLDALNKALEPFASRVCWDDEGGSLPDAHAVPCSCGKGAK